MKDARSKYMLKNSLKEKSKAKSVRALLLANASALALSACGGGSSSNDNDAPDDGNQLPDLRNFITGTDEAEAIPGTVGADFVQALDGNDYIMTLTGDDEVHAGGGDDTIWADAGNDVIYGGAGDDTIYPGEGDDTSYGGEGDDTLYLSSGNDMEDGGAGNDTIKILPTHSGIATTIDLLIGQYYFTVQGSSSFFNLKSIENVDSQANADLTIKDTPDVNIITTGRGDDVILSVGGNDVISTGGGNDRVELATGFEYEVDLGSGDDEVILGLSYSMLDGGLGTDKLSVTSADGISDFYADLSSGFYFFDGIATSQDGFDTVLTSFESVEVSGVINAELIGGVAAETFVTDEGEDSVSAGGGDDVISVGTSADTVTGGGGDDTIDLGAADLSADTVVFSSSASANGVDTITSFETGVDAMDFSAMTTLTGTRVVSSSSSTSKMTLSSAKSLVVTDSTAGDWSDVAAIMTAGINVIGDVTGDTIIAVNNGIDTRIYLYEDDAVDNVSIQDAELTLLATLQTTLVAESDFVIA